MAEGHAAEGKNGNLVPGAKSSSTPGGAAGPGGSTAGHGGTSTGGTAGGATEPGAVTKPVIGPDG